MNKTFKRHVTGASFHLTLSKSMIFHLMIIAKEQADTRKDLIDAGLTDTTVPTRCRLKARGLIVSTDPDYPGIYELTRAGELMVELLKEAGFPQ